MTGVLLAAQPRLPIATKSDSLIICDSLILHEPSDADAQSP